MVRIAFLLLLLCPTVIGCGAESRATVGPPPSWVDVPGVPWARVSKGQVDTARALGVPVAFENAWGMQFVLVPGGTFRMGSREIEHGRGDDEQAHEVRIAVPFFLQTQPLSAAQLARVSGAPREPRDDTAAAHLTAGDAAELARTLSEQDPVWAYRLPTEAEWEHACRAGTTTRYYWGDGEPADLEVWRTNAWGLRDMHTEPTWCTDRHAAYPDWTVSDPPGPAEGARQVVRGASRDGVPARSAQRGSAPPSAEGIGVRLAVPLGYGLGKYGSVPVTFRLRHRKDATKPVPGDAPYDLRFIRMYDRLAARTRGTDPVWVRVPRPGSPVTLTMVPGKYYVYAESAGDGTLARGVEIKFTVWAEPIEVGVPIPEADSRRYGSGAREKPQ